MWYIVYNSTTGEILRTGYTSSGSIASQAGSGESVMEGQAASDGSKMIDIIATPPVVIDNPEWEEPAASVPVSILENLLKRVERLENPAPGDLTVTFSGITNCGSTSDSHGQQAIFLNNTWTLTKVTALTYQYVDANVSILVMLSSSGGSIEAYIKTSPDNVMNFDYAEGPVARGGIYANKKTTCASSVDSEGSGGTCFIH